MEPSGEKEAPNEKCTNCPSHWEQFDAAVRLLEREDRLINARLTWYLTIQGFIITLTAYLASQGIGNESFKALTELPPFYLFACASLGIFLSLILIFSIRRARASKRRIRKWWESKFSPDLVGTKGKSRRKLLEDQYERSKDFPPPYGDSGGIGSWATPASLLPWTALFLWTALAIFMGFTLAVSGKG